MEDNLKRGPDIETIKDNPTVKNLLQHAGIPRRNQCNLMTDAERAIYLAILEVDRIGADPLLREAIELLKKAREKVGDFVDKDEIKK